MNLDKNTLIDQLNTLFPDNNQGEITPLRVRSFMVNVLDSTHLKSEVTIPQFGNFLNVKEFGAIGDNATNDTQAFIDALATGRNVFIPEGTYFIDSTLSLEPSQSLIGCGGNTTIHFAGDGFTNDSCFYLYENARLLEFNVYTTDSSNSNLSIVQIENENCTIKQLQFNGCKRAVYVNSTGTVVTSNLYISNCWFGLCEVGIEVSRDNVLKTSIVNCLFDGNTQALDLHQFNVAISLCKFRGSASVILRDDNTSANLIIIFDNCIFENVGSDINFTNGVASTQSILKFWKCELYNFLIDSLSDLKGFLEFDNCILGRITIAETTNSMVCKVSDSIIKENLNGFNQQTVTIIADNNIKLINGYWQHLPNTIS